MRLPTNVCTFLILIPGKLKKLYIPALCSPNNFLFSDRKIAKTAYLKVAYGGNIKLHSEYYNDDGIAPNGDLIVFFNKV